MKRILIISLSLALFGCQNGQITPQGQAVINAAIPIVDAAIVAAAASKGVPPSSSTAILAAINSLWGATQQANMGNPPAMGATSPAIGAAIADALAKKNITPAQAPAVLMAAAQQAQAQAPVK